MLSVSKSEFRTPTPEFRTRSPEFRARSPEFRTRSPEFRARSPEFRTRSPEFRARSPKFRTRSPESKAPSQKFRTAASILGGLVGVVDPLASSKTRHKKQPLSEAKAATPRPETPGGYPEYPLKEVPPSSEAKTTHALPLRVGSASGLRKRPLDVFVATDIVVLARSRAGVPHSEARVHSKGAHAGKSEEPTGYPSSTPKTRHKKQPLSEAKAATPQPETPGGYP